MLMMVFMLSLVSGWYNADPWFEPGDMVIISITLLRQYEENLKIKMIKILEQTVENVIRVRHLITHAECDSEKVATLQNIENQKTKLLTSLLDNNDTILWNFINRCDTLTVAENVRTKEIDNEIILCFSYLNLTLTSISFNTSFRLWLLQNHPDKISSRFSAKAVSIANSLYAYYKKH